MNWNNLIRRLHRWLAIAFTVGVLVNVAAMSQGEPSPWLYFLPLLPLAVLQITGLYMLVQPFVAKRRGRGTDSGTARAT